MEGHSGKNPPQLIYGATKLLYLPLGARAKNQSVEEGQTYCLWLDLLLLIAGHFG